MHRYAYVVVPADGESFVVFPAERYVGEHGTALVDGSSLAGRCGSRAARRTSNWRRLGVGLDYVMTVRDYALDGFDVQPFDVEFDLARAVKGEAELESVRDSVRINTRGFEIWHELYAPGKTAAR